VLSSPLVDQPDSKWTGGLAIFEQVEAWLPDIRLRQRQAVSQFLLSSREPRHGDLTDYAYQPTRALAYVCSAGGNLFRQLCHRRKKPFVAHYFKFGGRTSGTGHLTANRCSLCSALEKGGASETG